MTHEPTFAALGDQTDTIEVRLSYRIVELFSEGLYTSPNKAVEELVANSFDAGALKVHVLLSSNLHDQDATIAVFDDGEGMDREGLKRHWLIGTSNKRKLSALPRGRQQIGKFGIGKLATYVLANRLTHISKCGGKYYSTSMNYGTIDKRVDQEIEPKAPITLAVRELTETEAKHAVAPWTRTVAFKGAKTVLFGQKSPASWTLSILSSLKPKVHEIKPGTLGWVLRTALPLRPDFGIWLNGQALESSKEGQGLLNRWVLGKDLVELPRPSPKPITTSEDVNVAESNEHRFGLDVPGLGRITGRAEAYKDLLTGKSDEIGRSHGFFVYVYGRLLNVDDGHFGDIPGRIETRHVRALPPVDPYWTGWTLGLGPIAKRSARARCSIPPKTCCGRFSTRCVRSSRPTIAMKPQERSWLAYSRPAQQACRADRSSNCLELLRLAGRSPAI